MRGRVVADPQRGDPVLTHVTLKSANKKTGPMAATYRTVESCPTACFHHPDNGGTCYGATGHGGGVFRIASKYGVDHMGKVRALAGDLPANGMLRLNVVGDFLNDAGDLDVDYVDAVNDVARARPDVTIIAYTHAWRRLSPDLFDFVVNASCETADDVDKARANGWQAVLVLADDDDPLIGARVADKRVIVCPEQRSDRVNCANCGLCAKERPTVVGFIAHGARRRLLGDKINETR